MYLEGASAPYKSNARRAVEKLLREGQRLVTDAEVLQEILVRYAEVARRDAMQPAFDALMVWWMSFWASMPALSSGASFRHGTDGIERILSFDSGFDAFPGINRPSLNRCRNWLPIDRNRPARGRLIVSYCQIWHFWRRLLLFMGGYLRCSLLRLIRYC